ncbi:major facilitator superfamily domain-containing protein [Dactylonectria estremocensis]|uniref:Major facilitator superfamily domain-containing protein n=1 Tax=Dactylonectria estremocensis TaxID=1079267 RepID=A0A9P9E9V9_9HYPO|nr:major facilitator superfamily domain-containing protein [Dactylonectria estremocensis]
MSEQHHNYQNDTKDKDRSSSDVKVELGVGQTSTTSGMKVYGDSEPIEFTAEENKHVKRKIDRMLLPLMGLCYVCSFLDKTLLNYASIFGIKEALNLEGTDYSWLGSIFYIGYMVGSMMWSKLVHRWPQHVGKFVSGAVCIWSAIVLLTPLCFNFQGIMAIRFFLGLMESIVGPVFVIITSNWWTRKEHAVRTAFWLGGTPVGNFLGGILSYALGSIHGPIATWKIFFLFFGSLSFAFSFVLMYFMPDNQANARWLNEREKKIAIERVRENQTVTSDDRWKWPQFWEALKDPQTTFFFLTAMGNTMPSTFASQFSSQIVKGFGFSTLATTMISTCPAAVIQLGSFLFFSWIASRHNNIRLILSMITSVPPLIGASLLHTLPDSNQAGRLAGYYLTYTHTVSWTLNAGLMASNYAGNTKKSTASGIVFAGWAAGLIAGPQFFLEREAPTYHMAFKMLMVCYALMIVIPMCQISWYRYENGRRQRLVEQDGDAAAGMRPEFTDKTDFEKWETFRYTM